MAATVITNMEEKGRRRNEAAEKKLWAADEELQILSWAGRSQNKIKVQRRGRKSKIGYFSTYQSRTWDWTSKWQSACQPIQIICFC